MIEITHAVAGVDRKIYVIEDYGEVTEFLAWVGNQEVVAVDTETTGLDIFSDDYRVRLVQFGTSHEAWVIPVELGEEYEAVVRQALSDLPRLVFQNASFDILSLKAALEIDVDWDKIRDTKILAHLVDPRQPAEGGPGLGLSDLTRFYIDPEVADDIKDSMKHLAAEAGTTQGEVFKTIDLWSPLYLTYAGMDVILTSMLLEKLIPLIPRSSLPLIEIEHKIARICARMEQTGFLLDVEYSLEFSEELEAVQAEYEAKAAALGVENVNSTDQVAAALIERGVKITERTPSGKYKVDKVLLERLVAEGDELALAVYEAKKAKKWRATWVQKFLDNRDSGDRCHASIHPLQARTARMSITGIPAQTLPSGDWKVRRCFIPDPGESLVAVDYQAQELRVLAALSGDRNMIEAFATGADLHQMTADASGVDRSVGKTVNFAYVYGSGPKNIAKTCGISVEKAREVIDGFESTYPAVKKLSTRLQDEARRKGYIVTPSGRRIPVDKDRPYAALNYCLSPDTKILTSDLRHVDAETVKVGDQLVGFDEYAVDGPHRKFRVANVEAVSEVWKESVIVKTSDGKETICSSDHKWLVRKPHQQPRYVWVDASELTQTDEFLSIATQVYDGAAIIGGKQFDNPHIVSVTPIGMQKLISITTSTRTLIANGYLSHNCIQSTSRDVTAAALIRLDEAGFGGALRLPIHDEVLASVPTEHAEEFATEIAQIMTIPFNGVLIDTDSEVYGPSWGHGYKPDEESNA